MLKQITTALFAFGTFLVISFCPMVSLAGESPLQQFRTNLYRVDANGTPTSLCDGNLTIFDNSFSNNVDGSDVKKMSNFVENVGMLRDNFTLQIETRKVIDATDTVFFKIWQMKQKKYRFDFVCTALDHPGLMGFVEDKYLNKNIPLDLSGVTSVYFEITADSASFVSDRFRVIFLNPDALERVVPVRFSTINAFKRDESVSIEWTVMSEISMRQYEVEHSTDGRNFTSISTKISTGDQTTGKKVYAATDAKPSNGNNFYRIKGISLSGNIEYSQVIKVAMNNAQTAINVYPNPVKGNQINLQFTGSVQGNYKVRMVNFTGQPVYTSEIEIKGGQSGYQLQLNKKLAAGCYQLELLKPGTRMVHRIVIQ